MKTENVITVEPKIYGNVNNHHTIWTFPNNDWIAWIATFNDHWLRFPVKDKNNVPDFVNGDIYSPYDDEYYMADGSVDDFEKIAEYLGYRYIDNNDFEALPA